MVIGQMLGSLDDGYQVIWMHKSFTEWLEGYLEASCMFRYFCRTGKFKNVSSEAS